MQTNYIAIVIAGATNGGKTTVTDRLIKEFPNSIHLTQDNYFWEDNSVHHVWVELSNKVRHQDWERYSSLDWTKFDNKLSDLVKQFNDERTTNELPNGTNWIDQAEITSNETNNSDQNLEFIKSKVKLIIIEGHCVLCHTFPKFFNLVKKYFFTLTREVCEARRLTRVYSPPDPPKYFEEIVWPSYLEHLAYAQENHPDACFIDGEQEKEKVFQQIRATINDVYFDLMRAEIK